MNSRDPGSGTHAQAVIAVLEAKPDCAGELAALVRRLTPHVRAEPGCLGFIPYRAQTNAGRIYIYEVYVDAGAFDAHLLADYGQTHRALPGRYRYRWPSLYRRTQKASGC